MFVLTWVQVPDPGSIVSSLSDAAFAAKHVLRRLRFSASAMLESVEPHLNFLLKAEANLMENRGYCVEFLREWLRYGTTEVLACTSFISYSSFSRSKSSQDLKDQAARLRNERGEVAVYTPIQTRGGFLHKFDRHFG
jgi:hypothetical protein